MQLHNGHLHGGQIAATPFLVTAPTLTVLVRQQTSFTLQTSVYAGPGTHAGTVLQGRLDGAGDWLTLVWNETKTSGDLRIIEVTGLTAGTDYEFRAQHISSSGPLSAFGATLDARTRSTLTEFQQTNLLALMVTPIAGAVDDATAPARWPDSSPFADIGLARNNDPIYRADGPCSGLDVVEHTDDWWEDTTAGSSNIPNRVNSILGADGDFTYLLVARLTGTSTNTVFGCFTFGGDNILVLQLRDGPARFRVIGPGVDASHSYTPVGGSDLDVFCMTYDDTTRAYEVYHFKTLIGSGTFSSAIAFNTTHWVAVGNDRDPGGPSELFNGDMSVGLALWSELMGSGAREDNTDFAADNYTCAGSPGGGSCGPPTVSFANNVVSAGAPRVDILLLGTPPTGHTQSRYRLKLDADDSIVYPSGGSDWVEPGVGIDLTAHTASGSSIPTGVDIYAEGEWYNGTTWCGEGESLRFQITSRLSRADLNANLVTLWELGPEAAGLDN